MRQPVYHANFAHELTKRCASNSVEKLAGALSDAQLDLNSLQIEAALFAFRSPLSKGAILADEVNLGNPAIWTSVSSGGACLTIKSRVGEQLVPDCVQRASPNGLRYDEPNEVKTTRRRPW